MSIISESQSPITSILKPFPSSRTTARLSQIKVRFDETSTISIRTAIEAVNVEKDGKLYEKLVATIKNENELTDNDLCNLLFDAKFCLNLFESKFSLIVESLIAIDWLSRNDECKEIYKDFIIELLVAHNNYATLAITNLVSYFIPKDSEADSWPNYEPNKSKKSTLEHIHEIIKRLTAVIPMVQNIILMKLRTMFPYFKRPTYVITGYIYNMLWITEYTNVFREEILEILLNALIAIDVSCPRSEIEEAEDEDDGEDEDSSDEEMDEEMFKIDDLNSGISQQMKNPLAETLDVCMNKVFAYLEKHAKESDSTKADHIYQALIKIFENHILPTHNSHHVQFCIFYFCSLKSTFATNFINLLSHKVCNPTISATIRQASVGYLASLLARAQYIPLATVKIKLCEFSNWAHQYIQQSDSAQYNNSLKAHKVFYAVCQAIFYIIAFRSKHLTSNQKNLAFLQSLQLASLVTCHLNPLRVCLPAVSTAFAGVTRAHQLAYCHTILERNARRKLATIYSTNCETPDECLETFFPFDPYLLKKSGKKIDQIYLHYQPSDAEESSTVPDEINEPNLHKNRTRKHTESMNEDIDDFIQDKRQKVVELGKSFTDSYSYSVSPGFHTIRIRICKTFT
uniref:Putative rna polymerase i specific transcription initiation factor rrn3 n=1 Tax=Corethrella appendiculata TaxID=1370023 RepID=U5EH15_9DIPT